MYNKNFFSGAPPSTYITSTFDISRLLPVLSFLHPHISSVSFFLSCTFNTRNHVCRAKYCRGSQPLLVAFNQPDPPNPAIDADPEIVTYGNNDIRINDGPSALGYIFSIAASNAAFPRKYDNYAVPLLAMYARCLYLAYILGDAGLPNDEGVPYMGNCIYTVIAGAEPGFDLLLGKMFSPDSIKAH